MCVVEFIIYFKHKTAYDVRMSDWISDVCSSDHALSLDGPSASSTQVSTSRPWRDAGTRSWHKTARRRSASPASIPPNGRFDRTQPGNERPECHCIGTCRRNTRNREIATSKSTRGEAINDTFFNTISINAGLDRNFIN